ncbi:MAG: IS1634 family transposase [bacterium]|nr:IS1634 family transposase [bacterium]
MESLNLQVESLDHLGIIASTIKDLNLINLINEKIGTKSQEIISTGEAIAGMILNGLGFTSEPMYLSPKFFEGKALKNLFDRDLVPENFNATKLSKSLDAIYDYGLEKLFLELSVSTCKQEKINTKFQSLDTTSISLTGEYDEDNDEHAISIKHGYSKDKRPDLKQIVHEMLVSQDGGIPLISKSWNGNESDVKIFQSRAKELIRQLGESKVDNYLVADSKLYNEGNSDNLSKLKFITRIPSSIKKAKEVINASLSKNIWTRLNNKDKYYVKKLKHYGIEQRWIIIYSLSAHSRAIKHVDKAIKKENLDIMKNLKGINKNGFECENDAISAAKKIITKAKYHTLEYKIIVDANKKNKIESIIIENEDIKNKQIEQKSCYIIGSNIDARELNIEEIISGYKGQNASIENMGFRFLKDPKFFTSSLFVKLPRRIESLLFIMTLSLLVYSIAQKKLRDALEEKDVFLPNQLNKPTKNPTLKWIFKLLNNINVVYLTIEKSRKTVIEGINELKEKIINFFGANARKIYGFQT